MSALALIIAIIALILAILAYQRTGGELELKRRLDTLSGALDNLREKTADLLDKMETALRKGEQKEEGGTSA
ncbi:MAG: hypothetical protein DRG31_02460 [Deltaproteobacteria bacterium]|nr:MAG: hypothetical protein DRG31_02460 [Deltaproteobacteria bacterium]